MDISGEPKLWLTLEDGLLDLGSCGHDVLAALVTALMSLLETATFPRDTQVGEAEEAGPSPWDQGWIWVVLM